MATGDDEGRGGDGSTAATDANAAYVFRVTVRLEPGVEGVWATPDTFETTVFRAADPPGEPGWLYFRDNLWRGECGDESYMREVTEDALGTTVASVSFSELRTTQGYLDDLRETIADNLDLFNASTVDEVLSKYLGSSIHVTSEV
ncbi:LWR-salt protein [Halosimplex aquaticum]|uniref:LWR-salt protein n=1 Tax=Halosimplex aquaticum TaxID=3026162 RepID=A0ABD5Y856_9EURY|nr:LWR-salt protein [Halosimplex aquaticum]